MQKLFARTAMLALPALALSACAATGERPGAQSDLAGLCKDGELAAFTGRKVTAELGTQLLAASSARTLRWGPPRSAMTMDFRPDRLTVAYDDNMLVTNARCG